MSKIENFPVNYKPKFNLKQTYEFMNEFKKELFLSFEKNLSGLKIPCPLIKNKEKKDEKYIEFFRKIKFDNFSSNNIFFFNNNHFEYFDLKADQLNLKFHECLFSESFFINRDAKLKNNDSIIKEEIYFYFLDKKPKSWIENIDKIVSLMLETFNMIILSDSFKKYNLQNKIFMKWNTVNLLKILPKFFKKIDLNDYVSSYINKNGLTLITGSSKEIISEEYELLFPEITTKEKACSLYVFNEKTNCKNRILKLFYKNFESHEELENIPVYINIDLSNLFMYLLEKIHISEVVASSWDEKFEEFIILNNFKIM